MNADDDRPDVYELTELSEMREITAPTLSVLVDFNDLLTSEGERRAFDIVGKLKDLLT